QITQFRYKRTSNYGGPKLDEGELLVKSASVSEDRRRVFLELDGMKPLHVLYVLLAGDFRSDESGGPWTTEAWYTMNRIPQDREGKVNPEPVSPRQNTLSEAEKREGWELLFDGESLEKWRGFGREEMPEGWQIVDGALTRV